MRERDEMPEFSKLVYHYQNHIKTLSSGQTLNKIYRYVGPSMLGALGGAIISQLEVFSHIS